MSPLPHAVLFATRLLLPRFAFVPPLLFALVALLASPAAAQEVTERAAAGPDIVHPGRVEVTADEVRTFYFTPSHVSVNELEKLASRLYGRVLWVTDRGSEAGPVQNIQRLGESLVIYDTPEYAQRLGEALHGMDEAMEKEAAAHAQPESRTVVEHWAPKHVGLNTAVSALTSFRRNTMVADSFGAAQVPNVSIVQDLGQLVLRDTREQVDQMLDVLTRIDRPEQQLYVTCLVIRGQAEVPTEGAAVPEDLTRHLSQLVPFQHFTLLSMGIVRSSAIADGIGVEMDGGFHLRLRNQGFDPGSQGLTADCAFSSRDGQKLETRTTIRAGEYTVLGATGSSPLFAVLRIEPVDG